jgi:hypothetical protein
VTEILLADRVEAAIRALDFGDALPGELTPNPANYSAAEKAKIIRDHTLNVARLDGWVEYLQNIEQKSDREVVLKQLLDRRVQECCSILMSLLGEAN